LSLIPYYTITSLPRSEGKSITLRASLSGSPPEQGAFLLFPGALPVRLKSLRRDDPPKDGASGAGLPDSIREEGATLEVRGIARAALARGARLVPEECAAAEGQRALFLWKKQPPGQGSVSFTIRDGNALITDGKGDVKGQDKLFTLISRRPFLQIPGRLYTMERGGRAGEAVLLMAEPWSPEEQKKLQSRMKKIANFPGEEAVFSMNLRVRGAVRLPSSLEDREFEGALRCGPWALMSRVHDRALSVIEKRSRAEEGIAEEELSGLTGLPSGLCAELCRALMNGEKLIRREGRIYNRSANPADFLSPMSRSWLLSLGEAGFEGFSLKEVFLSEEKLRALGHRGLIRVFEGFVVEEKAFLGRCEELLKELPRGTEFTLADIKGIQGLSRSRLLILLEALEAEGKLSREGENRRITE
jgi:hypothetical protein